MKRIHLVLLFAFLLMHEAGAKDSVTVKIDSGLVRLVQIQKQIKNIHPYLETFHPIAVYADNMLYIYDFDSLQYQYRLIKKTAPPFPLKAGIRASFPLSVYGNEPTCIVSAEIFDSESEMVLIFHEFMHCVQAESVEFDIKKNLHIYKQAMDNKDYMWEINHPFPYNDSVFVQYYDAFFKAVADHDAEKIMQSRRAVKNYLNTDDYEYMV